MTKAAQKLGSQLLALSPRDRVEIAHMLWDSVNSSISQRDSKVASRAWLAELRRRSAELKKDPSRGIPAQKVFAKIRKRLS